MNALRIWQYDMHADATEMSKHQTNKRPPDTNSDHECHGPVRSPHPHSQLSSLRFSRYLSVLSVCLSVCTPDPIQNHNHVRALILRLWLWTRESRRVTALFQASLYRLLLVSTKPSYKHKTVHDLYLLRGPLREYRGIAFERAMF